MPVFSTQRTVLTFFSPLNKISKLTMLIQKGKKNTHTKKTPIKQQQQQKTLIMQVFRRKEKQRWGEESSRLYGTKTGKDMNPDPITHKQRLGTPGRESWTPKRIIVKQILP